MKWAEARLYPMHNSVNRKSGQAIIFLMVVVVIGLFVVIWNFDLHRVITAKIRVRNAADAAALAGARWQGVTLNMIGDLNLIQVALLSNAAEAQDGAPIFNVPPEVNYLHDLRNHLALLGPLAAFEISQRVAFDNGLPRDSLLEDDLRDLAEAFRNPVNQGTAPYDNAYKDYADLLDSIADNGAAVSSYTPDFKKHPLSDERFYSAIAQAMGGWWCPMKDYRYALKHYTSAQDWPKLDTRLMPYFMMDLKLHKFTSVHQGSQAGFIPGIAIPSPQDFSTNLVAYLKNEPTGIVQNQGKPNYIWEGMYPFLPDADIIWHIYGSNWARHWPKPTTDANEEDDQQGYKFPLRNPIRPRFDYMGAESGVAVSTWVGRGILATSSKPDVDLVYKAKAKLFGFLDTPADGMQPPYYFGFVFPVHWRVRLIHSDIGDHLYSAEFYRHVTHHLKAYLEGGSEALAPNCRYCRLLKDWESLDRDAGLKWLDDAKHSKDNPCKPENDGYWDGPRGGATSGS